MEDADRLFDCLKCGLSTPKSVLKGRTKSRDALSQANLTHAEASPFAEFSTPSSAKTRHHSTSARPLYIEKLGTPTVRTNKFNSGRQISPGVFYGSPHGVPAKRPSQLLRLLREIHVDLTEQNDLPPRKEVWATFPRQDEAVKFARNHAQVSVFSYQDHLNGQRRFLVSTYEEFWRRYKNMDPKFHHHYEVIQEGLPCHLYFDLEFNNRVNTGRNGDKMVDLLMSIVLTALFEQYSIQGNQEWTIELDSSTDVLSLASSLIHTDQLCTLARLLQNTIEKFSRHLIIRIPSAAFKDNSHVGAFVAEICSRISSERERDPRFEQLYVLKDGNGAEVPRLFLDTAVYTRNRCFRLALSSKAGKSSVLLPTGRFKCKNMSEEQMFFESLICRIDPDCEKLLICKTDFDCKTHVCFDFEARASQEQNSNAQQGVACRNHFPGSYVAGKSPFPALDRVVESIINVGNISGKIRSWYWFSDYGLMVYNISGNRYCERIGRQHKSNHVMYVVDFKRAAYYQKCYDPDCKGYRSPLHPLPIDVIPDTSNVFSLTKVESDQGMSTAFTCQIDRTAVHPSSSSCDHDGSCESSKKDRGWWLEAIKAANDIESMRKALEFGGLDGDGSGEHDYDLWTNVEVTAFQSERTTGTRIVEG